ncbi:MAG: DUF2934 domain-containing protein [Hyphomicrobiales bacterium]|nr:DUF2934 domain-containing protein [Hyphomicrobiales bacterium]
MAKKTVTAADKKASSKPKANKKDKRAAAIDAGPAIQLALRVDDHLIRERAYGIWLAEGRPHGRDLAHWQRAHQELLTAQ